jgi:hypothetical protein
MYLKKRKNNGFLVKFTAVLIILTIFVIVCFFKMRPVIINYGLRTAKVIAINAANTAVINVIKNNNIAYNDIVNLARNESGAVTSLETDIVKVNTLKSEII